MSRAEATGGSAEIPRSVDWEKSRKQLNHGQSVPETERRGRTFYLCVGGRGAASPRSGDMGTTEQRMGTSGRAEMGEGRSAQGKRVRKYAENFFVFFFNYLENLFNFHLHSSRVNVQGNIRVRCTIQ